VNEPGRIALGVLFLAILAAALIWVLAADDASGGGPASAAGSMTTTATAPPHRTIPPAFGPTTGPTSTAIPATASTAPADLPPPANVELSDVLPAAQAALEAWGEFAVGGELALLADTFDKEGPQYGQLVEESPTLLADPLGPPPYVFAMGDVELRHPRPPRVVLVGPVSISRPGEPEQRVRWRLHLRWSGSEWLLWTIEDLGAE
jgi:hypothetical protein